MWNYASGIFYAGKVICIGAQISSCSDLAENCCVSVCWVADYEWGQVSKLA